jgi:hypothetical protein
MRHTEQPRTDSKQEYIFPILLAKVPIMQAPTFPYNENKRGGLPDA